VAPGFARLTQTLTARIAGLDFVSAARIAGVGRARLIVRHFLPNIGEPLVVNATIAAGGALLSFAGLSFLGLGVQAPDYDWGRLLGEGLSGIYINPAAALAPGIAVVVAGLAFNLSGETVARAIGLRSPAVQAGTGESERVGLAMTDPGARPVLTVDGLRVAFPGPHGPVVPVRDVTFTLQAGETAGIVGESGSGKSLTALALAQLLEPPARVTARGLRFLGVDLLSGPPRAHRRLLGTSMAMVFQDPMTSLNPTMRVGRQLAEVAEQHGGLDRRQALVRAVERLQAVHLTEPARRARQFPHELSGGMRQRAMIGLGLMVQPALIVADEPTTALDTTVQRQVLRLLRSIRDSDGVALLLISHDLTVVGDVCDRVLVMYAGRIVEDLPSAELPRARHPYTRALLASVPNLATDRTQPLPTIPGRPADPARLPAGCAFAPRCPLADARCRTDDPPLQADGAGRVACWHAGEEPA
jgi:oligopeptide/dipeptide ABC transporter ATP-binding protein